MGSTGNQTSTARRIVPALLTAGLVAVAAALATAVANSKPDPSRMAAEAITVQATLVDHFDKAKPGQKRFGKLEFRGGLVLTSSNANFGGWSGLVMDADGKRFLAISDAGSWMTGELAYEGTRPKAITAARIGPILGLKGKSLARGRDRDAEGAALLEGTLADGIVLISFERTHRIGRFPVNSEGLGAPSGYLPLPADSKRMTANKGLEGVCVLRERPSRGAVLALAERFPSRDGHHVGWVQTGQVWQTLSIRNIGGFDLVDCVGTADGGLVVLERRFRWSEALTGVKSRLRRFGADEVRPGVLMEGEVLLEADMGQEIDNLEGLAAHTGSAGETVLTLISDDNFSSWFQRTILLQFSLGPGDNSPKAAPR